MAHVLTILAVLISAGLLAWLSVRLFQRLNQAMDSLESRLTQRVDGLGQDFTASLLQLEHNAVQRITDISQAPAQVVRVEVPAPAVARSAPLPGQSVPPVPRTKREVTLIFMDSNEVHEVARMRIDPLRRATTMTNGGTRYTCVRGSAQSGEFIYRQET